MAISTLGYNFGKPVESHPSSFINYEIGPCDLVKIPNGPLFIIYTQTKNPTHQNSPPYYSLAHVPIQPTTTNITPPFFKYFPSQPPTLTWSILHLPHTCPATPSLHLTLIIAFTSDYTPPPTPLPHQTNTPVQECTPGISYQRKSQSNFGAKIK